MEPFLTRSHGLGGIWESVLSRMPNRTLWLHGDSITTQVCEAAYCSLVRSRVVRQPPLCTSGARHPSTPPCHDVDRLSRSLGMQLRAAVLPNGARLLCSAVGVLERQKVAAVLSRADVSVAVINYGLHCTQGHRRVHVTAAQHAIRPWAPLTGRIRYPCRYRPHRRYLWRDAR